jgi:hypothetical protein
LTAVTLDVDDNLGRLGGSDLGDAVSSRSMIGAGHAHGRSECAGAAASMRGSSVAIRILVG